MYDPLETDLSFEYLKKIMKNKNAVLIGGWATYFHVNKNYRRAFGIDYLRSRDIDVCVKSERLSDFIKEILKLGFKPSSYFFRYELIYSRNKKTVISEAEAKKHHLHDLVYVFLDLFTDKESDKAWGLDLLKKAEAVQLEEFSVVDINTLIGLKCLSFFEREKLDKELKDACDLYALLIYSGEKIKKTENVKETIKKLTARTDLMGFISENVLRDITKVNIVLSNLKNL